MCFNKGKKQTCREMGLSLSLLMLLISWSCDKASRSGPIEASLTRFFMSEPEYPANAQIDPKPLILISLKSNNASVNNSRII